MTVGTGNVGQLGFWLEGAEEIAWNLTQVEGLPPIKAVSTGCLHTLFLGNEGEVFVCGSGKHGKLGLGHERNVAHPVQMKKEKGECFVGISAGDMHSLFVTTSGNALACGNNKYGQLGLAIERFDLSSLRYYTGGGSVTQAWRPPKLTFPVNLLLPVEVWLAGTVVAVAAGGNHSVFLTDQGEVWTSGCNYNGQLGLSQDSGWEDTTPPPSPLPPLKGIFEVQIGGARNLPKMDIVGSCDAFCQITFQRQTFMSSVKKNTYSPSWQEIFGFNFSFDQSDDSRQSLDLDSELEIVVKDWDRLSSADQVGRVIMKKEIIEEMLIKQIHAAHATARKSSQSPPSTDHNWVAVADEMSMDLLTKDGIPVMGKNGAQAILIFDVKIVSIGEKKINDKRRMMEVSVACARNLPKMDIFGTCDAFCQVFWQGVVLKSDVVRNTLNPDWQVSDNRFLFNFPLRQIVGGGGGDLTIKVLDWDQFSSADEVGQLVVPAATLQELVLAQMAEQEKAREGKLFRKESSGNNLLKEGEEEAERMRGEEEKRRKIRGGVMEVQVKSAKHLPQMDLFAKCDPFCELLWLGQHHKTSIKKNTLAPIWNETYEFSYFRPLSGDVEEWTSSQLSFILKDWDRHGEPELVGQAMMPAGQLVAASQYKSKPLVLRPLEEESSDFAYSGLPAQESFEFTLQDAAGLASALDML
jgi:hypothetical protein